MSQEHLGPYYWIAEETAVDDWRPTRQRPRTPSITDGIEDLLDLLESVRAACDAGPGAGRCGAARPPASRRPGRRAPGQGQCELFSLPATHVDRRPVHGTQNEGFHDRDVDAGCFTTVTCGDATWPKLYRERSWSQAVNAPPSWKTGLSDGGPSPRISAYFSDGVRPPK